MVTSIAIGILVGGYAPETAIEFAFIGDFFLHALKMLVIPLVITSMIAGVASLGDIRKLEGIGGRTITYYMITTGFSVLIGIVLVVVIAPGKSKNKEDALAFRGGVNLNESVYEIKENTILIETNKKLTYDKKHQIILSDQLKTFGVIESIETYSVEPKNVLAITVKGWQVEVKNKFNKVTPKPVGKGIQIDLAVSEKVINKRGNTIGQTLKKVLLSLAPQNLFKAMAETKVLPIIIFSLIFGAILTTLGTRGEPVIAFFIGANEAILKFVQLLMYLAPVGVGCLIAGKLGQAGGMEEFMPQFKKILIYALTVIIGLLIHAIIILPIIFKLITKRSVFSYLSGMSPALLTAFSTASSSATLPLTIQCTTENNNVSEKSSNFVLPLGATINMDGTALYEAVAAIFIAQLYGIDLSIMHLIIIFFTATLAAIGAAGIPEAGLVTLVIVLGAVGLPIEGISMILIIDWFLDRCRTTVNVWGDSIGAAIIDKNLEENTV
ncbi:MAG: dicarboxylate/amino acid:cation symporter [Planctomycetota bacterium]|nr:MAG: dicarboxylate/amino acid:cation symporter [Planctomycetota bacterium]